MMRRHWADQPSPCFVCGARFRSAIAEARHRHNFPALCKRNKQFAAHMAKYAKEKPECEPSTHGGATAPDVGRE